jgi:hypothetical protein
MAAETFVFNIAKGRIVEFYNRVKSNDPAASAFILVPMATGGTQAQGQDLDTMAAVEADANFAEQVTSWTRKTLTDAELVAFPAPDDTNDRYAVAVPSVTWTAPAGGNNVAQLIVCYDANTGSGTDSDLIPCTAHVFAVTADGNDVVLTAGDFLRAS